jgi:hypothetical protein
MVWEELESLSTFENARRDKIIFDTWSRGVYFHGNVYKLEWFIFIQDHDNVKGGNLAYTGTRKLILKRMDWPWTLYHPSIMGGLGDGIMSRAEWRVEHSPWK